MFGKILAFFFIFLLQQKNSPYIPLNMPQTQILRLLVIKEILVLNFDSVFLERLVFGNVVLPWDGSMYLELELFSLVFVRLLFMGAPNEIVIQIQQGARRTLFYGILQVLFQFLLDLLSEKQRLQN